jgi:hypothetical protein
VWAHQSRLSSLRTITSRLDLSHRALATVETPERHGLIDVGKKYDT